MKKLLLILLMTIGLSASSVFHLQCSSVSAMVTEKGAAYSGVTTGQDFTLAVYSSGIAEISSAGSTENLIYVGIEEEGHTFINTKKGVTMYVGLSLGHATIVFNTEKQNISMIFLCTSWVSQ